MKLSKKFGSDHNTTKTWSLSSILMSIFFWSIIILLNSSKCLKRNVYSYILRVYNIYFKYNWLVRDFLMYKFFNFVQRLVIDSSSKTSFKISFEREKALWALSSSYDILPLIMLLRHSKFLLSIIVATKHAVLSFLERERLWVFKREFKKRFLLVGGGEASRLPPPSFGLQRPSLSGLGWFFCSSMVRSIGGYDEGQTKEAPQKVHNVVSDNIWDGGVVSDNIREGVFGSAHSRDVAGVVSVKCCDPTSANNRSPARSRSPNNRDPAR
jgi:hypothetical protein